MTLFDFGERRAGLAAARARLGGAQADAAATRADVRLSVQSAFYALAAAQDLLGVAGREPRPHARAIWRWPRPGATPARCRRPTCCAPRPRWPPPSSS